VYNTNNSLNKTNSLNRKKTHWLTGFEKSKLTACNSLLRYDEREVCISKFFIKANLIDSELKANENLRISSCRVVPLHDEGDDVHLCDDQREREALPQGWGPHDSCALTVIIEVAQDRQKTSDDRIAKTEEITLT
jgi:hypothetical protein